MTAFVDGGVEEVGFFSFEDAGFLGFLEFDGFHLAYRVGDGESLDGCELDEECDGDDGD